MSVFDEMLQGIGNAVTDIRQRVVEEPYFGRVVTEAADPPPVAEPVQTAWQDFVQQSRARQPEHELPLPDHGLER